MKKSANRYAGQSNFPPQQGYGGMGHGSLLFGMNSGTNLMQAAMAGQHNPNAAKNLHMPQYGAATQEGIMAAAQKVADYALGEGISEGENGALLNWLEEAVSAALTSNKQAKTTLMAG